MYSSVVTTTLTILTLFLILLLILMPYLLRGLGLHPSYVGNVFNLENKSALIISTSHGLLNYPGQTTGKKSGLASHELTAPYYEFVDANMKVDIASIKGGEIPVDPLTISYFVKSSSDKRFYKDESALKKLNNAIKIDDVNFTSYDVIFISGGWGGAYDLGTSDTLARGISDAYYAGSIIGAICHGPLGLINAKDLNGRTLIKDRRITGVTNKQVKELGISMTPQHPERELKRVGVIFESQSKFRDVFANLVVVDDEERFVTGQNQNAGHEIAQKIMEIIAKTK